MDHALPLPTERGRTAGFVIANYLVNLIKEKKGARQIIFATHNANFVVNADCELTYILVMLEHITTIDRTTLENLEHREILLKLEGGRKALDIRERKYRGYR